MKIINYVIPAAQAHNGDDYFVHHTVASYESNFLNIIVVMSVALLIAGIAFLVRRLAR